ncbi:DUF2514 family protein [Paucibacter sp. APW11]|uniref:DUF2514 family protein n=1 Tax=Roseateles aquae TaxID=3077235 RepID=A0ABU3P6X8_9BURK|nr:DUF2514 family protein [Paucibacter sp. APW11]MDT8998334.1 DUF2514 family protein [Paucibacter sp. APW11]
MSLIPTQTGNLPARLLALAICLTVAWGSWAEVRASRAQAAQARAEVALSQDRQAYAAALASSVEQARQQDLHTINQQREALNAAQTQTDAAQHDRDRAAAASRSLREQLATERARATSASADPEATEGCRAAAASAAMLADLLGRCSGRRRELAEYADRARIAGQFCEQSYEALTP